MRFMIQVEAGMQWLVERAIRTEILDEFWNEYGSATTITGDVKDRVDTVTSAALSRTPLIDVPLSGTHDSAGDQDASVPAGFADEEGRDPAVVERGPQGDEPEDTVEDETPAGGVFRSDSPSSRWKRVVSLGGRVRPSTSYLFGTLFVLIVLKALTVDAGEDGPSGLLAPPQPTTSPTTVAPEPVPSPELTATPVPTTPVEPTAPTPTTPATPPTPGVSPTPQAPQQAPAETPTAPGAPVTPTAEPAPEATVAPEEAPAPTAGQPQVTPDTGE